MANPTVDEMWNDLAAADAAGDTELATAIASKIKARPGAGESIVKGAEQGVSLGFADELKGLRRAVGRSNIAVRALASSIPGIGVLFQPNAEGVQADVASGKTTGDVLREAILGARKEPTLTDLASGRKPETFGSDYRQARDADRARVAEASQDHPWFTGGGELAGALLNPFASLGAAGKGASLAQKVAAGAKAGAGLGAVAGAGSSEASTVPQLAMDTVTGAAAGGAGGAILPAVGAGIRNVASRLEQSLQNRAVESGRKALSGIGTPLAARKEIPEAVVNQALDTGAIRPFGTVTGTAERLATQADELGAQYGQILKELEAQGVTGPNAVILAKRIASEAAAADKVSLGSVRPKMLRDMAEELPTKVDPTPFASKRLGLMQAEEIKRGLQSEAKREYDKITRQMTTAGETKKDMASIMRQAIEDEVSSQAAKAPDAAAQFMPVKSRLANTLSALRVAEEGSARAARRAPPSIVPPLVVGSMTGSPGAGIATLLARLGDRRVASTVASAARGASKAAGKVAGANLTPTQQAEAESLAALIAALRSPRSLPMPAAADEESAP